ncbi:hypothetical protein CGCA056_v005309 [Colletotrichum aenigma]|uniref:uncharacterized protein n=1 Tax=Colletotrichum aenigma TaxID=1215731 RepID=UPI0018724D66|nr:uncharacterized protein CGCA056_v005309 [Colletotrichum aenigma]KAF5524556.1 hypothetical protein CGCA056_v005309 [Colletotrichum aenigma]
MQDQRKGKAKEIDRSDADVALDTYQAELLSFQTFAADRAMSRCIAHQEGTHPALTQQTVPDPSNPITSQPAESSGPEEIVAEKIVTEETIAADAVLTVCNNDIHDNDSIADMPESSSWEFITKEIEFSTVNRTYCHQPQCSGFIPPTSIEGDIGTCPACQAKTCVLCKSMEHDHADACKEDTATQEVLKLAADKKWPRCNKCHAIVELDTGCYHMSEFSEDACTSQAPVNACQLAAAEDSSAISAKHPGRPAIAANGTSPGRESTERRTPGT